MKILLSTSRPNSASFLFYSASLSKINDAGLHASVNVTTDPGSVDYREYDVVLFMGGCNQSVHAKERRSDLICGVIEPRSAQRNDFAGVDLIIFNSLEAQDFYASEGKHSLVYYTYPEVPPPAPSDGIGGGAVLLGYHGNKIHLEAMVPRITRAIQQLHRDIPIELHAMYNIAALGQSTRVSTEALGFPVRHVQYSHGSYARYMAPVDVGLVPQFIPTRSNRLLRYLLGSPTRRNNEKQDDLLLRLKETTNLGRHFVFAQYGIPVISDMTPSACSFIEHGHDGYVAYSTGGWLSPLRDLAGSAELRRRVGGRLREKWAAHYSHEILNRRLVTELRKLVSRAAA